MLHIEKPSNGFQTDVLLRGHRRWWAAPVGVVKRIRCYQVMKYQSWDLAYAVTSISIEPEQYLLGLTSSTTRSDMSLCLKALASSAADFAGWRSTRCTKYSYFAKQHWSGSRPADMTEQVTQHAFKIGYRHVSSFFWNEATGHPFETVQGRFGTGVPKWKSLCRGYKEVRPWSRAIILHNQGPTAIDGLRSDEGLHRV